MELGNDWMWIAKQEKEWAEINDDDFGGNSASLHSTFVRVSEGGYSCRWREPCPKRGAWTAEIGLDSSPTPQVARCCHVGHHLSTLLGSPEWEPCDPLRISTWGYFIWYLSKLPKESAYLFWKLILYSDMFKQKRWVHQVYDKSEKVEVRVE